MITSWKERTLNAIYLLNKFATIEDITLKISKSLPEANDPIIKESVRLMLSELKTENQIAEIVWDYESYWGYCEWLNSEGQPIKEHKPAVGAVPRALKQKGFYYISTCLFSGGDQVWLPAMQTDKELHFQ